MPLTPEQKRQLCGLVGMGCDREIAAHLVGTTWGALQRELTIDEPFANDLVRNEATAELVHVRNVQEAGRDPKNWRSSTWWLERRAPDRYARREARSIRPAELEEFLNQISQRMGEMIADETVRNELIECFQTGAAKWKQSFDTEASPHES